MIRKTLPGLVQLFMGSFFADWRYVLSNLREDDGALIMTGHFEGKFTGDIDLSLLGLGVIPASGEDIVRENNE